MTKTIRTQDGKLIEVNDSDRVFIGSVRINNHYSEVYCTFLDKNDKPLRHVGVIGKFFNDLKAREIKEEIRDFIKDNNNSYLSVPIDLSKDWLFITERICENKGLVMATIEEASLYFKDKREAKRLAEETDYFERKNIILYDKEGFSKSFNKWKQLHMVG